MKIKWEDPPAEAVWPSVLAKELNRWAVVSIEETSQAAAKFATMIRSGQKCSCGRYGVFEAVSSLVNGEHKVFARCVSLPPKPEPLVRSTQPSDHDDTPIARLDLSVRANNCLESADIKTIGDLRRFPEHELLKIRSMGKTSLREIKRALKNLGIDF